MKEGASDPFADSESESESGDDADAEDGSDAETNAADVGDAVDPTTGPPAEATSSAREGAPTGDGRTESGESVHAADARTERAPGDPGDGVSVSRADLPYVLARDTVKDRRPSVHQLFVQEETDAAAKDAERELEDRIGEDVYRLDAREAIYLAGIRNLDDAASVLRRWGYDL
jgi:hypothetical protein